MRPSSSPNFALSRTARENDVRTAVADVKEWAIERPETKALQKLDALEERLAQLIGRSDSFNESVAAERADRRKEIAAAVEEVKGWITTEFEADLSAFAERVKSVPGRLPVARSWEPQKRRLRGPAHLLRRLVVAGAARHGDDSRWQRLASCCPCRPRRCLANHPRH